MQYVIRPLSRRICNIYMNSLRSSDLPRAAKLEKGKKSRKKMGAHGEKNALEGSKNNFEGDTKK